MQDVNEQLDRALRPHSLQDFVGQPGQKERLEIMIESAISRSAPCDHLLVDGSPGLGKTTIARILAEEMGSRLVEVSGPSLRKPIALIPFLQDLQPNDILFVDEIHGLPRIVEEMLYPAMEDFVVEISDHLSKTIYRMPLQPFTLVGATTKKGAVSRPLRDRFGMNLTLDFYEVEDLAEIVLRSSSLLGFSMTDEAARMIAGASRGTPRIANNLLRRVRDYARVRTNGAEVGLDVCRKAMDLERIDSAGLNQLDRAYMNTLLRTYGGGPVGLEALGATLGVDAETLSDSVEPFLLHDGYIARVSNGRCITIAGRRYMDAVATNPV